MEFARGVCVCARVHEAIANIIVALSVPVLIVIIIIDIALIIAIIVSITVSMHARGIFVFSELAWLDRKRCCAILPARPME